MIFHQLSIAGSYLIEMEKVVDERGFFARTFCLTEFSDAGLPTQVAQCNISHNNRKGTLRGLHYQQEPFAEAKLVRCARGAIFDVIVDLRRDSVTHCQWKGVELTGSNGRMLFVPHGCAHGYMTLQEGTEVVYQMTESFHPELAAGVRWDDPAFGIEWPDVGSFFISQRDQTFADYQIT